MAQPAMKINKLQLLQVRTSLLPLLYLLDLVPNTLSFNVIIQQEVVWLSRMMELLEVVVLIYHLHLDQKSRVLIAFIIIRQHVRVDVVT